LEMRGALCVTLVIEGDDAIGFLLIPKGRRRSAITIEEAEALQLLAGRVGALLAVSSALARSAVREQDAEGRARALQITCDDLVHNATVREASNHAFAETLARPVRAALYSAAARMAAAQIERLGTAQRAIVFEVPPGVDAVGWAAHAHLSSPSKSGPFVVEAAFSVSAEGDGLVESIRRQGTLVLLGFDALPMTQRDPIERWLNNPQLAQHSTLLLSIPSPPHDELDIWVAKYVARGVLHRIKLPPLADRAEDLQALIFEHLTRIGTSPDGEPWGIEPAALRFLLDQTWPGNDAELKGTLARAVARCRGTRVTLDDLELPRPLETFDIATSHTTDLSFSAAGRRRHSPRKH